MVHLVVFEDHELCRIGVKRAFEGNPDIRVAGEARGGADLFSLLACTRADMALLGVNNTNSKVCVDVTRRLRSDFPHMKILAMASENTRRAVQSMMKAGIDGYIGKRQTGRVELEKAIRQVAEGGKYIGKIDSFKQLKIVSN